MGYKLNADEAVATGLRRVVRERIMDAFEQLGKTGDERHKGIHAARKRCKEIRSTLRLVRKPLGNHYRRENDCFRDLARQLAGARDAQALLEARAQLAEDDRAVVPAPASCPVHDLLIRKRDTALSASADLDESVEDVRHALLEACARVKRWPLGSGFGALAHGFKLYYRRGRERMAEARKKPSVESLHEWRKRVKDYWYHTKLLRMVWPPVMKAWRKELKNLSDYLGDEHDLALLAETIEAEQEALSDEIAAQWLALIDKRRKALRARAFDLGRRVYAEKPAAWIRRHRRWWASARR